MPGFFNRAPSPAITWERRKDRATDELIGICRGLLADGATDTLEASFLKGWIERNEEFSRIEPFKSLYRRLADALQDGVVDDDEERELLEVLHAAVGGEASGAYGIASESSTLPLCSPAPSLQFNGAVFVATGTFQFGNRRDVHAAIEERGGIAGNTISRKLRYLVIGEIGSRDWIHSSFGRKIEQAMQLRADGLPVSIVSEHHWSAHL